MAPRRGGGSSYYGSSNDDSRWNQEISFSLDLVYPKSLFIAGFAFYVLTLAALLAFLVWACTIRNHKGQLKGVISALLSWFLAVALGMIYKIFFLADATVTYYYVIVLMLQYFFGLLSDCLILFVFYNIIHGLLNRLTDSGKPYAIVQIVHWVLLGIISAISIATWGLYVAFEVALVNSNITYYLAHNMNLLSASRSIILWVMTLEILAWTIFVAAKAGSHRFASKPPIFSLLIGSIFWFALRLMNAVIAIRYNLEQTYLVPYYTDTARAICEFFFCIGIFTGILFCCMNWPKLGVDEDKPQTATYPTGPGEPYQTWQPYPQPYQSYPQPYPQQYPQAYPPQQQPQQHPSQDQHNQTSQSQSQPQQPHQVQQ